MHTKEFYFVRHGETDNNKKQLLTDSPCVPLNQTGVEQAHSIRKLIHKLDIKTVCHSPYTRAVQTKDIITNGLDLPHVEIPELSECSGEQWVDMVNRDNHPNFPLHVREFIDRSIIGINKALNEPGPVLVVAHGGIHYAFCHHMQIKHEWIIENCVPIRFSFINSWKAQIL